MYRVGSVVLGVMAVAAIAFVFFAFYMAVRQGQCPCPAGHEATGLSWDGETCECTPYIEVPFSGVVVPAPSEVTRQSAE